MMKNTIKWFMAAAMSVLLTAAAFAADYDLNDRKTIDLSGVEEVEFDLRGVSCSLCVRTVDIESSLNGRGSGRSMDLTLTGNMRSNRERAVPSIIVDEGRTKVTVRLYPERRSFFGLSQSGTALFEARLPESFTGTVKTTGSSDDITVTGFNVDTLDVRSSSGDLTADDITAGTVSFEVSSGDLYGDNIRSAGRVEIESSSGDLEIGRIDGSDVMIGASSGRITVDTITASGDVNIKASSGRIRAGTVSGKDVVLDTSSGDISVDELSAGKGRIDVSSGDVELGRATAESLDIRLSSGRLRADTIEGGETTVDTSGNTTITNLTGAFDLNGSSGEVVLGIAGLTAPVRVNVSSGDIELSLPGSASFDARLETSSGRIRSEFPIMGDLSSNEDEMKGSVNGGGILVDMNTSSGNISLLTR